jgi:hypothetical protein
MHDAMQHRRLLQAVPAANMQQTKYHTTCNIKSAVSHGLLQEKPPLGNPLLALGNCLQAAGCSAVR